MLGKKTSVLLVTAGNKENKHFHVPSSIIKNWKKIAFVFIAIIAMLTGVIAWMVYSETGSYYREKLAKSDQKVKSVTSMVDIQRLKNSFKSIDSSLSDLNKFLQDKGIGAKKLASVGGEEGFEISNANEVAAYYEARLKNIKQLLQFTPLGYPCSGEKTSHFGYRSNPFSGSGTESHFGIDFRGKIGDTVKSTADGIVKFSGVKGGYGNCIIIEHGNGYETLYGHLSKTLVNVGKKIIAGQLIGELGSTGRSTGPHLHYEVMLNGEKINPESFFTITMQ